MDKSHSAEYVEDNRNGKHDVTDQTTTESKISAIDIHATVDEKRSKALNRRLDFRVLPLCCWVYLLNFLYVYPSMRQSATAFPREYRSAQHI